MKAPTKTRVLSPSLQCLLFLFIVLTAVALSAEDKFFDSNGVQIRYVDQGSGQPIVLIHGYTSSIEPSWVDTSVLPNLAKDHRVIALDYRGHGKSGKPRDPKAYGTEMGQDVVRLLDHLNIARAHIVGYSLGGNITAKLLTTNPDRFLTATLGGSSGRRTWTPRDEREANAEADELEHGIPFRSVILRSAPTDQPKPTEEAIGKRSEELVGLNDPAALAALVRSRRELVVTDAQMAAVQVPTLAIVGGADPALADVKTLKTAWPALKVVVIEGATHAGDRGAAGDPRFVNAIRDFIATYQHTTSRLTQQ